MMEQEELERIIASAKLRNGDNYNASRERYVAEISFKVGIKEVVEFKCDECATPGFVHLIIPVKKLKEWGF